MQISLHLELCQKYVEDFAQHGHLLESIRTRPLYDAFMLSKICQEAGVRIFHGIVDVKDFYGFEMVCLNYIGKVI